MSIRINVINESEGESLQELSDFYSSPDSNDMETYNIGMDMTRNLEILKKVLRCSKKDVLVVDTDSDGKAGKLFSKLSKSSGEPVKSIKLEGSEGAIIYNYNGIILVGSKEHYVKSFYYAKKDEDALLLD